jgi:hypothetical protein
MSYPVRGGGNPITTAQDLDDAYNALAPDIQLEAYFDIASKQVGVFKCLDNTTDLVSGTTMAFTVGVTYVYVNEANTSNIGGISYLVSGLDGRSDVYNAAGFNIRAGDTLTVSFNKIDGAAVGQLELWGKWNEVTTETTCGSLEPETIALLTPSRYSTLNAEKTTLINNFYKDLKAYGLLTKSIGLWILKVPGIENDAKQNFISNTFNLLSTNAPVFTAGQGYSGNGVDMRLNTTFIPSVSGGAIYTLNSAGLALGIENCNDLSAIGGATGAKILLSPFFNSTNGVRFTINSDQTFGNSYASALKNGDFAVIRTASGSEQLYIGDVNVQSALQESSSLPAAAITMAPPTSAGRLTWAWIGAGLSAADWQNFRSIVTNFITAFNS